MGRLHKKKNPEKKKKKQGRAREAGRPEGGYVKQPRAVSSARRMPVTARAKGANKEKNFFQKSLQFLREVKVELKKVTWPTRKQTLGSTVVVIILVMIISLFLGLVDMGLSSLIRVVLR